MARMYGAYAKPCCPHCRTGYGPDCADKARGKSAQRLLEKRQWHKDWEGDLLDAAAERYELGILSGMILWWDGDVRSFLEHYYDYTPVW